MKSEISGIRRNIDELRARIGSSAIRPVYRLIDDTGAETGIVDIKGTPTEPTDDVVVFTILEAPFRLLVEGKKHTVLPHGRGAGISSTIARYVLGLAIVESCRILAAREIQLSLRESVWYLLGALIDADPKLSSFFTVQNDGIFGTNGSHFLFRGIRSHTVEAIKSMEDVRYCWIEECQSISHRSHDVLVPTVRSEGARFFWSLNPTRKTDPVFVNYLGEA